MTDAEKALVESCAERGVKLDEMDAEFVLLAQKVLARDPKNESATKVMGNFAELLKTGKTEWSFAVFDLKDPDA